MITSVFPTVCTDDVAATRDFYVDLLGMTVLFDSGWYVQLGDPTDPRWQVGVVLREHPSVPEAFRHAPAGVLVAVEVDDVDAAHARAVDLGLRVVQELRSEEFGQRHFMTVDPAGCLVDVITPIEPGEDAREHGITDVGR